ncbi:MAG: sigma-70 family RNA polymerase sigma factor [Dehalococcoidia bacterium]
MDRAAGLSQTLAAEAARLARRQSDREEELELVRRAQRYEPDALGRIYEIYFPKIYQYSYLQLSDPQLAEDIASGVLLQVVESIDKFHYRGTPFGAWVFRIARNRIIDLHRRKKRRQHVELNESIPTDYGAPHQETERVLEHERVRGALDYLTDDQRQVVLLKFAEGLDNQAIASVIGRSEGAVKSLQHRALVALRKSLSDSG